MNSPLSFSIQSKTNRLESLMKPFDFYQIPEGVRRILTLKELHRLILEKEPTLINQRKDVTLAEEARHLLYSNYRPQLQLQSSFLRANSYAEVSGQLPKAKQVSDTTSLGLVLSGDTTLGLDYSFNIPTWSKTDTKVLGYEDSSLNSVSYSMGWQASASLNLLKDSYFFKGNIPIIKGEIDYKEAEWNLKNKQISVLAEAETAFFNLYTSYVDDQILKYSYECSKALYDDLNELYKVGEMDKLSLVKVELEISNTQNELINSKEDLDNAIATLSEKIGEPIDTSILDLFPDPKTVKELPLIPEFTVKEAIQLGKQNRLDYKATLINFEYEQLALKQYFGDTLPSLALKGTYGHDRTSGNKSYAEHDPWNKKNLATSIGLFLTYNIFDDASKSAYRSAKINFEKMKVDIKSYEISFDKNIISSVNAINSSNRKIKTIQQSNELSETKLKSEYEKYRVGESTIKDILDYQKEVNDSRKALINQRIKILTDLRNYKIATGQYDVTQ